MLILVLFIFSSLSFQASANTLPVTLTSSVSTMQKDPVPMDRIATMKIKEAEKILGRKFSLKEKIAFKIAQIKLKKDLKAKVEGKPSKGQNSMVLGIIGLACLLIPFGVIASIPLAIIAIITGSQAKRENKDDRKAQTGIILGIVTLGLIALAILLVIAIIASGGFWVY